MPQGYIKDHKADIPLRKFSILTLYLAIVTHLLILYKVTINTVIIEKGMCECVKIIDISIWSWVILSLIQKKTTSFRL